MFRLTNLALTFLLELCALAGFAAFGADVGRGISSALLGILLAAAGAALWGTWAAPKSSRRLPDPARAAFELCFFALALAAFLAVGLRTLGIIFGVAVLVNTSLLGVFGNWRA